MSNAKQLNPNNQSYLMKTDLLTSTYLTEDKYVSNSHKEEIINIDDKSKINNNNNNVNVNGNVNKIVDNDSDEENLNLNIINKQRIFKTTSHKKALNKMFDFIENDNDDLTNLNWLQDGNLLKKFYYNDYGRACSKFCHKTKKLIHSNSANNLLDNFTIGDNIHITNTILNQTSQRCEKPPYSYSLLIFMAIESSKTKSMMVREIYDWIIKNYPYFLTAPAGWKNTIRHTLSLRKCFKKVNVSERSCLKKNCDIKGGLWYVDADYRTDLQQQVSRISSNLLSNILVHNKDYPSNNNKSLLVNRMSKRIQMNNTRIESNRSNAANLFHQCNEQVLGCQPKLLKLNASYLVLNPKSSIRINNLNIYRNLVSVISVNQAPKLYAPMPIFTRTATIGLPVSLARNPNDLNKCKLKKAHHFTTIVNNTNTTNNGKNYFNLLKDKQNVCLNYDHLATSGLKLIKQHMPTFGLVTNKNSLSTVNNDNNNNNKLRNKCSWNNIIVNKHQPRVSMPTETKLGKDYSMINKPNHHNGINDAKLTSKQESVINDKVNVNDNDKHVERDKSSQVKLTSYQHPIDHDHDNDDEMLQDGAQALLNFASKSFLFNLIN